MTAAPWLDIAADALTRPLRQLYTVTASHPAWGTISLEVDPDSSPHVVFDEGWVPACQVSGLVVRVPDLAALDRLDARTGIRLSVSAGYVYPGGDVDVHTLANLVLVDRVVNRPANTMTLTAESDERLMLDNSPTFEMSDNEFALYSATDSCIAAIVALVGWSVPAAVLDVDPLLLDGLLGGDVTLRAGGSFWDVALDLADRIDARLYNDATDARTWHLERRPNLADVSSVILSVGPGGTITDTSAQLSRDEWANKVVIRYKSVDGVEQYAFAKLTSGPFTPELVPAKVLVLDRDEMPAAGGSRSAAAILARTASRGRSRTLTALSTYWLRPGATLAAQLVTGAQERHLVARVDFDLAAGTMNVKTRQPSDVTIDTGE